VRKTCYKRHPAITCRFVTPTLQVPCHRCTTLKQKAVYKRGKEPRQPISACSRLAASGLFGKLGGRAAEAQRPLSNMKYKVLKSMLVLLSCRRKRYLNIPQSSPMSHCLGGWHTFGHSTNGSNGILFYSADYRGTTQTFPSRVVFSLEKFPHGGTIFALRTSEVAALMSHRHFYPPVFYCSTVDNYLEWHRSAKRTELIQSSLENLHMKMFVFPACRLFARIYRSQDDFRVRY
jgi:hypothetical protein